jgi:GntR family transcriptional regulator
MSSHESAPLRGLSRETLVAKAHAELLDAIQTGAFAVGKRLPSEHELARSLGVSRPTVRQALGQLQLQGHITRRPGDGTYVADPGEHFVNELDRFDGVDKIAAEQGLKLVPTDVSIETVAADASIADALAIPRGSEIYAVTRTLITERGPAIHMIDFLPMHLIPADKLQDKVHGVIRDLITEAVPNASFSAIDITGKLADVDLARQLQLPPGGLVLVLEETVYTDAGVPVEFSRNYCNPIRLTLRTVQARALSASRNT